MSPCSGRERAIHYCLPDGALFSSVSHVSGPLFSEGSFITGYGKGGMILRGGTDGRDRFTVFRSASFCLAQRFRSDQRCAAGSDQDVQVCQSEVDDLLFMKIRPPQRNRQHDVDC